MKTKLNHIINSTVATGADQANSLFDKIGDERTICLDCSEIKMATSAFFNRLHALYIKKYGIDWFINGTNLTVTKTSPKIVVYSLAKSILQTEEKYNVKKRKD